MIVFREKGGHPLQFICENKAEASFIKHIFQRSIAGMLENGLPPDKRQNLPEFFALTEDKLPRLYMHSPAQAHLTGQIAFNLCKAIDAEAAAFDALEARIKKEMRDFFFKMSQQIGNALEELAPGFLEANGARRAHKDEFAEGFGAKNKPLN